MRARAAMQTRWSDGSPGMPGLCLGLCLGLSLIEGMRIAMQTMTAQMAHSFADAGPNPLPLMAPSIAIGQRAVEVLR